jgi:hypothetical protein
MAKNRGDRISKLIEEVEKRAKHLREAVRKRASRAGLPTTLDAAAKQLRKRAAAAAEQVEKYAHQIATDLEGGKKTPPRHTKAKPKKAARRRAGRTAETQAL